MFEGATEMNSNYNAPVTPDASWFFPFSYAFSDRDELRTALDKWINGTDQEKALYGDIENWNVESVTDLFALFRGITGIENFNSNISNWNVSNVTTMLACFENLTTFNQPLDQWDVSNVKNMSEAFINASSFNQDITNWDVSNVTSFMTMFLNASSFNQNVRLWDASSALQDTTLLNNQYREYFAFLLMFQGATKMIENYVIPGYSSTPGYGYSASPSFFIGPPPYQFLSNSDNFISMFVLSESQKKNNKYYITTTPELPWLFKENLSDEVNEENIKQAINKLGLADDLFLA